VKEKHRSMNLKSIKYKKGPYILSECSVTHFEALFIFNEEGINIHIVQANAYRNSLMTLLFPVRYKGNTIIGMSILNNPEKLESFM